MKKEIEDQIQYGNIMPIIQLGTGGVAGGKFVMWAEKKNKKKIVVEKINLKIGEFTCVEPISLINTFNAAVLGSWLDSSEITIETIPFEGKCSKCNRLYFPKKENGYKSPCCNFNLEEIISGRELKIASIDFKEK